MALSTLPYLLVWWYTPLNGFFPGVLYTADDHGVYFSWMRQAADGRLLFRNLFTTEPQQGAYFHLLFLLLGWLSRLPGLDIPTAYHLGRVLFGMAALVLVYRLAGLFTADVFARRCVFWVTALGSGLGWLFWQDHTSPAAAPVDVWQAEALVPTSLYVNAMYAAALALMLGFVICLLLAERHGPRWALGAGLCALVLGNVHSYDVIHLAAAWTAYLALRWIVCRRFPAREVGYAALAGLVASPSVLYMAWLYATEPIFRARADTATLSFSPVSYLLGFGLLIPLALWGAVRLWTQKDALPERPQRVLPPAWAVAGILVAYAPFAFQRKMIMGADLPLGLLAGLAVASLAERFPKGRALVAAAIVAALSITTLRWPLRDVRMARTENLTSTLLHPAYWPLDDIHAFEWLHAHSPSDAALLTYPLNGMLAPAYSGRRVWAGHWGETPRYDASRFARANAFYWGTMSSAERAAFLRENGLGYVVESSVEQEYVNAWAEARRQAGQPVPARRPLSAEPFLERVFHEAQTTVYQVRER